MNDKNIIRIEKNKSNPYVMIDKRIFSDKGLSWKAKGLLGYLLSKPNDWRVIVADLIKQSTDGRDSVYTALKELINAGYIEKNMVREKGKIVGINYTVREQPTDYGNAVNGKTVYGET